MDVLIGQKRKNQKQKQGQEQKQDQKQEQKQPSANDQPEEEVKEFKYLPINPSKVTYLDNFAYIEQVDHRIRLVTLDYEMYY